MKFYIISDLRDGLVGTGDNLISTPPPLVADIISAGAVTIPADFRFSEFVLRNYPVINISPNLAPQLFRFWTPKSIRISP